MAIERERISEHLLSGTVTWADGSHEEIEVRQVVWRDQHGFETSTFEAADGRELDMARFKRLTFSLEPADAGSVTFHGAGDT